MIKLLLFIVFFLLFTASGIMAMDPDFGWHIRFGELTLKNGIPHTDPFSYTMPRYNFINHEWLTDIVLAKTYAPNILPFISAFFSLLVLGALLLQLPKNDSRWITLLLFCASFSLIGFTGIRPQIISWFFFSLILSVAFHEDRWNKWRLAVPFLFLLWANLHGGFPMGLMALGILVSMRMWSKKRFNATDTFILVASLCSTLINPYGLQLWKEIWVSMSDASLRWTIAEWQPPFSIPNFIMWGYIATSGILVYRYTQKLLPPYMLLYSIFLLAGLSSARNMPFWIIISLPITIEAALLFQKEATGTKGGSLRLSKIYHFIIVLLISFVCIQLFMQGELLPRLDEGTFYPKHAVTYLKKHPPRGNIFAFYGWGGYLIWRMPEEKVFVDGRMPSWKQSSPRSNESAFAFGEYRSLLRGTLPLDIASKKYAISVVLLPKQPNDKKTIFFKRIVAFFGYHPPKNDIYQQLHSPLWKQTFSDDVSIVYEKVY